jgi:hypothetical protein
MYRIFKILCLFLIPFFAYGNLITQTPIANMGQMPFSFWQTIVTSPTYNQYVIFKSSNPLDGNGISNYTNAFTINSNWVCPSSVTSVQVLLVGAGGSAANSVGAAGGGAGGVVLKTVSVTPGTSYAISVGNPGGIQGINTTAFGYNAAGGGSSYGNYALYMNGGSGAGGSVNSLEAGGTGTQPASASGGFGNNGGTADVTGTAGGGGGGAGAVGSIGNVVTGANGGNGYYYSVTGQYYGGGGAGANGLSGGSNAHGTLGLGNGVEGSGGGATYNTNLYRYPSWLGYTGCVVIAYNSSTAPAHGSAVFTTVGNSTWNCPTGVTSVTVYIIGGGGGGDNTGGGGAGGFLQLNNYSVTPGNNYSITVGNGGGNGSNGGDSVFNGNTGYGGHHNFNGGGIVGSPQTYVGGSDASGDFQQGGGGASPFANGGDANPDNGAGSGGSGQGGDGAIGRVLGYWTSANTFTVNTVFGGGGGGGNAWNDSSANGGVGRCPFGGGGTGGSYNSAGVSRNPTAGVNYGAGGGGGNGSGNGASGYQGVVIITW